MMSKNNIIFYPENKLKQLLTSEPNLNQLTKLNVDEITKIKNTKTLDCYYGIDSEDKKEKAMELIISEMSKYSTFIIHYDFRVYTKFKKRQWHFNKNVMIYENKNTKKHKILSNGKTNYECIFWISTPI